MGDLHRVIKARDKKFSDPEFEKLMRINPANLKHELNPSFTRPAYAYTSAEAGRKKNGVSNV